MIIREANMNDLNVILQLYLYLHEERLPEDSEYAIKSHTVTICIAKMV